MRYMYGASIAVPAPDARDRCPALTLYRSDNNAARYNSKRQEATHVVVPVNQEAGGIAGVGLTLKSGRGSKQAENPKNRGRAST